MAIDTSTVWLVPPSDRTHVAPALGVAGLSALAAYRLLAPGPPPLTPVAVAAPEFFSAEEIAAGRSYRRPQSALSAARTAVELGLLAALVRRQARRRAASATAPAMAPEPTDDLASSPAEPERETAPAAVLRPALAAAGTAAALGVASTAVTLPLSVVSRRRALAAGLATDSWSDWARDLVMSTAIESVLSGALLAGSSVLASRRGERWWRGAAAGIVGVGVAAGTLGPVLLDPIFNTFTPLPDGDTRTDVMALAAAAGVRVGEVFSVDASRRSTAVNAYVNGLGPTKRVVLFDTMLESASRDEVRFVVAHELGHVAHRDMPRQIVFLAVCAPGTLLAMQQLTLRWAGSLSGGAAVPALSLAAWVVGAPLVLCGAALSRAVERRTDHFGLGLSGAPEALISFFRQIAVQNRADVTPAPPWRALLASHPPITERIGAALAYQAGTTGPRTPAGS